MPSSDPTPSNVPDPHGGRLCNLVVSTAERSQLEEIASTLPAWTLGAHQLCDLELLTNGAFSPLDGFMGQDDYEEVVERMRLADGTLWPLPIVLDVTADFGSALSPSDRVLLRDPDGTDLAVLSVSDVWRPDLEIESDRIFGTQDNEHPGVRRLTNRTHPVYVGGTVEALAQPAQASFATLRDDPGSTRHAFSRMGWHRVVAVSAHGPMHRAEVEMARRAMSTAEAQLRIHLALGPIHPGDADALAAVRCAQTVLKRFPGANATLGVSALATRMAGPRETLWQAIVHQNHGCSHFLVPSHHADPRRGDGKGYHDPTAGRDLMRQHLDELGIDLIEIDDLVYHRRRRVFVPETEIAAPDDAATLSADEMKDRLRRGQTLPDWFTYPEVEEILQQSYPPTTQQGFAVLLAGSGPTSAASLGPALVASLAEATGRPVTLLDSTSLRDTLSSELGCSPQDEDTHARRLGFVASLITKHRGIAVCAGIAPAAETGSWLRETLRRHGGLVEVFVDSSTSPAFSDTGSAAPSTAHPAPEGGAAPDNTGGRSPLRIDTRTLSIDRATERIVGVLRREGYLSDRRRPPRGTAADAAPRAA